MPPWVTSFLSIFLLSIFSSFSYLILFSLHFPYEISFVMPIQIPFPFLLRVFFLCSLFSFSFSDSDSPSAHQHRVFPRPLIVEYAGVAEVAEETRLRCGAWRVAGEANNLGAWKTVPEECAEYVKEYMTGKGYLVDLEMVSKEAEEYAKSLKLSDDGKDAWIFDIDETLLSNLPYYAAHGFG